jgi:hypothetical protein
MEGKTNWFGAVNKMVVAGKKEYTSRDITDHLDTAILPYPNPDFNYSHQRRVKAIRLHAVAK